MASTEVTVKIEDIEEVVEVLAAAYVIAGTTRSFVRSLPYAAPEKVPALMKDYLLDPLEKLEQALLTLDRLTGRVHRVVPESTGSDAIQQEDVRIHE